MSKRKHSRSKRRATKSYISKSPSRNHRRKGFRLKAAITFILNKFRDSLFEYINGAILVWLIRWIWDIVNNVIRP